MRRQSNVEWLRLAVWLLIEGERSLDIRQLQPRRLLFLDLLYMQIVKVAGQPFFIRQL